MDSLIFCYKKQIDTLTFQILYKTNKTLSQSYYFLNLKLITAIPF